MAVDIPPSPRAEDVPEYAQRLREVQELARKKPTRRRRKARASQGDLSQIPRRTGGDKLAAKGQTARWVRDCDLPKQEKENDGRQCQNGEDTLKRPKEKVVRRDRRSLDRRLRKEGNEQSKPQRKKESSTRRSDPVGGGIGRVVATSMVVSIVVSLLVTLTAQGLAHEQLVVPGTLFGMVLTTMGMGS